MREKAVHQGLREAYPLSSEIHCGTGRRYDLKHTAVLYLNPFAG
jgi:hypothetical protein